MNGMFADKEEERAVSPVIGVILMVAITVILAAVIAGFVLDMGPSEADPTAAVSVENNGSDEVTIALESTDQNTDGVAIVAPAEYQDGNSNTIYSSGEVIATISVSGDSADLTWSDINSVTADNPAESEYDFEVHAYNGADSPNSVDDFDQNAISEEFTVVEP